MNILNICFSQTRPYRQNNNNNRNYNMKNSNYKTIPKSKQLSSISYIAVLLAFLLFSCALFNTAQGAENGDLEPENLLERIIKSLEAMLRFFEEDYSSVNVDGLFGIRAGQGSVNQTIKDCQQPGFRCPEELVRRLRNINARIEQVASHAMPYVEEQDPEYLKHFRPTVDGPYILHYQTQTIGATQPRHTKPDSYNEKVGDMCLSSLMGMWEDRPRCAIPNECWDLMTKEHTEGYTLTHQLLYFIVGDKTNCVSSIEDKLKSTGGSTLRDHETKQCTYILSEARSGVHNGRVPMLHQDLFMEQVLVCGMLGYLDFLTPEWVSMVLSWQSSHGCFSMSHSLQQIEAKLLELENQKTKLFSLMRKEAYAIDNLPLTGRKLMREKIMKDDCLAHKTGLGFGLVGASIRQYVRVVYAPEGFQ